MTATSDRMSVQRPVTRQERKTMQRFVVSHVKSIYVACQTKVHGVVCADCVSTSYVHVTHHRVSVAHVHISVVAVVHVFEMCEELLFCFGEVVYKHSKALRVV